MRKYLLLASVAGCLLSAGNAMADTSEVAADGKSARMDVYATLKVAPSITDVTDMKFGTIYVKGSVAEGEKVASLSTAGKITVYNSGLSSSGTPAAGTFTVDSAGPNFSVTCGKEEDNKCIVETGPSGMSLLVDVFPKSGTIAEGGSATALGGDLYFRSFGSNTEDDASGSITVTLSY